MNPIYYIERIPEERRRMMERKPGKAYSDSGKELGDLFWVRSEDGVKMRPKELLQLAKEFKPENIIQAWQASNELMLRMAAALDLVCTRLEHIENMVQEATEPEDKIGNLRFIGED
jgi:hypothetical protein